MYAVHVRTHIKLCTIFVFCRIDLFPLSPCHLARSKEAEGPFLGLIWLCAVDCLPFPPYLHFYENFQGLLPRGKWHSLPGDTVRYSWSPPLSSQKLFSDENSLRPLPLFLLARLSKSTTIKKGGEVEGWE